MKTEEMKKQNRRTVMVIFGATGDLTHKKLMPALYNLLKRDLLPEDFHVIAVGRQEKTSESYRQEISQSIADNIYGELKPELFGALAEKTVYHRQDFSEDAGYTKLKEIIGEDADVMYYLAVAPQAFEVIIGKLGEHGMQAHDSGFRRVVIEKPFGADLKTAEYLNEKINAVFPEKDIYRIDHYLGKEMLQNIIILRFANAIFEPIWNKNYIDNIQITSSEDIGVGSRGGYYEHSGALRDMLQNHLLQLLSLTVMEPPRSLSEDDIRIEKLKVLRSLNDRLDSIETVRGQYGAGEINGKTIAAYRDQEKVDAESDVETFVATKMYLNTGRWQGVPIYIRTGKALKEKTTEVVIELKETPYSHYFPDQTLKPNLLVIKIQPEEGMVVRFCAKSPGALNQVVPVGMDFCQNCQTGVNSPEAYERLLHDVMRGDATLFTRWEEVEASWIFADRIKAEWDKQKPDFPNYAPGSWGPKAADELLRKDGRRWWVSQTGEI